ncbi:hypothetical protein K2173_017491 [Erythroxylum novogranatense]|uniref:Trichome birefringence-like N-terminal domain-containing protein n=1 Tax=Erythroxylum novogranatense TaxID=1862640 RepID=A0AAV8TKV4_9ROSI|nr:hypothetical protein K2173_017491 [Erythroxylum novogranatense]
MRYAANLIFLLSTTLLFCLIVLDLPRLTCLILWWFAFRFCSFGRRSMVRVFGNNLPAAKMKGGLYRFRFTKISLFLTVLMCTTILLWAWERAPHVTALLPPKVVLQLSKEVRNEQVLEVENHDTSGDMSTNLTEREGKLNLNDKEGNAKGETQTMGNLTGTEGKLNPNEREDNAKGKTQTTDRNLTGTEGKLNSFREDNAKVEKQTTDMMLQLNSKSANSSFGEKDDEDFKGIAQKQACNYAKGKWIVDDTLPLYSGFDCKEWLSSMWSCRLTQRKDFAFEKLRWQPKNCEMESFEGSKFLGRLQDKTLAFVGDSLGRQQFQSMMCMITAGKQRHDVIDVGHEYGLIKPRGSARPNGWAFRFQSTNTTVLYYWSACLCDLEPINKTNPATDYAMHLDQPPAFLRQYLPKLDFLVLNTGHHWNRGKLKANRWVMYVGGMPNTNRKLAPIGDAKNFTIHSIVKWVHEQLPKHPHLKAFYRSISPRHFFNGEWNTGGSCDNTTPMSVGKEVLQDDSSDYSAGHAVKGTGVKLLDITALSQLRDEGHMSRFSITAAPGVQDCLHWCLPGVPDTWNQILAAQIGDMSQIGDQ